MTDQKERGLDWLPDYREIIACQEEETSSFPVTSTISAGGEGRVRAADHYHVCRTEKGSACQIGDSAPAEESSSPDGSAAMLAPEELAREEEMYWKDYEYITRLLPLAARECWAAADAVLDRYEYEDSAIYQEYPDKNTIWRIADTIYEMMHYVEERPSIRKNDGSEASNPYYVSGEAAGASSALKDMIFTMTVWNMSYRRQRYLRRRKVFPLTRHTG